MSIWLIILASLYLLLFISWCFSKWLRSSSEKLSPLLNLLGIMAAVSVFVQLYITIDIFNDTKKLDYEDKIKQFEARMTTLQTELRGNLNVCKFILENQADSVRGSHLPQNYFYFLMLEGFLRSGEIFSEDLLNELYSAYHYMMLSQRIMDRTVNLEHLKVLVNPDDVILKQSRKQNEEQMGFLIKNTNLAQGFILSSLDKLPEFREEYVTRLGSAMAEKLDEKELVSFKEMMMANSIQVDALAQLLIEKGLIREDEFYSKLKQAQMEYESMGKSKVK